jgi:riboflavin biosynthesis pyrimidine reductase
MRVLFPDASPAPASAASGDTTVSDDDLENLYAYPADRRWVRANFVATLDGSVQGPDSRSRSISSTGDKRVFALLRSLSDVILVGAGTARSEAYMPVKSSETRAALRKRHGLAPVPPLAVVTRTLGLSPDLLRGGRAATIVITVADAPSSRLDEVRELADVIVAGREQVDLGVALDELETRGHRRILCEGGPTLTRDLAASGQLDELCLTVSPTVLGGDGLRLTHGEPVVPPPLFTLEHLLLDDDNLLCRFARRPPPN